MKALERIATVYPDYTLITGAHNVDPDKLTSHIINKIVVGKISIGICLSRSLAQGVAID
jgi:hypothetical protein